MSEACGYIVLFWNGMGCRGQSGKRHVSLRSAPAWGHEGTPHGGKLSLTPCCFGQLMLSSLSTRVAQQTPLPGSANRRSAQGHIRSRHKQQGATMSVQVGQASWGDWWLGVSPLLKMFHVVLTLEPRKTDHRRVPEHGLLSICRSTSTSMVNILAPLSDLRATLYYLLARVVLPAV